MANIYFLNTTWNMGALLRRYRISACVSSLVTAELSTDFHLFSFLSSHKTNFVGPFFLLFFLSDLDLHLITWPCITMSTLRHHVTYCHLTTCRGHVTSCSCSREWLNFNEWVGRVPWILWLSRYIKSQLEAQFQQRDMLPQIAFVIFITCIDLTLRS